MSDRRVAVVTGAGRGIGEAAARRLASDGFAVYLIGRSASALTAAARMTPDGLDARGFVADISGPEALRAVVQQVERAEGRVDVLINNAGVHDATRASEVTEQDLERVLRANVIGTWMATRAFLPLLSRSEHPRIVNVSSGAGMMTSDDDGLRTNGGREAAYAVSKAAVNAMTIAFASELAETPVVVNAVCPGFTASRPEYVAMGARPLEDGVDSVLWAARLPDDGPRGGLFRDGRPLPW